MKRIRIRPLALFVTLGVVMLIPIAGVSATSGASTPQEIRFGRGFSNVEVLPALFPDSRENTSAIAQNNGTAPATIVMDIYTPAGVLIPSASVPFVNVPVGGTRVFAQAINTGLTPGFRGVGVLSSDQPINALLVRDIESNTGFKSYSIHNVYPTGGSKGHAAVRRQRAGEYVQHALRDRQHRHRPGLRDGPLFVPRRQPCAV